MPDGKNTPEPGGDERPPIRLDLDEQPEPEHASQPIDWRRVATMLGLVVATAVATVFVVNSRHEVKLDEIAASEINLTARPSNGRVQSGGGEDYIVSDISLYNAGPRAVEVSAVRFPGREPADHLDAGPWTIKAGAWQRVQTAFVPDCTDAGGTPNYVDVTASAEARNDTVRVDFPVPRGVLFPARDMLCSRGLDTALVTLSDINVEKTSGDALSMIVVLGSHAAGHMRAPEESEQVRVTSFNVTTPGLSVVSEDIPLVFTAGEGASFDAQLQVTDCEIADTFRDLQLSVEWTSAETESPLSAELEPASDVVVAITRYVADTCGS